MSWEQLEALISRIQRETAPPKQNFTGHRTELRQNAAARLPGRLRPQSPYPGPLDALR